MLRKTDQLNTVCTVNIAAAFSQSTEKSNIDPTSGDICDKSHNILANKQQKHTVKTSVNHNTIKI